MLLGKLTRIFISLALAPTVLAGWLLSAVAYAAAAAPVELPLQLPWGLKAYVDPDGIRLDRAAPGDGAVLVVGQASYATVGRGETRVQLHEMDAAPFIQGGRTFVPLRYLAYAMGISQVGWDDATRTVVLTGAGSQVRLVVGDKTLWVNDSAQAMDVAPVLRQGRAYLPARFVATAFGWQVHWDEAFRAVVLLRE